MENIQFQKNYSALIDPIQTLNTEQPKQQTAQTGQTTASFAQILRDTVSSGSGLTFSKHALQRMDSRQIEVSPQLLSQMSDAVEKARDKGVKDALIFNGSTAFIVNVPSSTVVTTMNGGEMKDNIFTNIDGAVIL
jgi:flagellar operon protein